MKKKATTKKASKKLTWAELAQKLGVTRQAVTAWRKKYDDCPKVADLNEWKQWLIEHPESGKKVSPQREDLLCRKITSELVKLEINNENDRLKLEHAKGNLVSRDDVDGLLGKIGENLSQLLSMKLRNELPGRALGLNSAELRKLGADLQKEILLAVRQPVEKWSDG